MTRLHQSRRQKIGYTYNQQVQNNVSLATKQRLMSTVQNQAFEQNMKGAGLEDVLRGSINLGKKSYSKIKDLSDTLTPEQQQRLGSAVNKIVGDDKTMRSIHSMATKLPKVTSALSMVKGNGLGLAGAGTSIQPSVGSGLNIAGQGLSLAGGAMKGKGLSLAGGALPGDMLRKKLLQKMVREKRMKPIGDRKKSSPLKMGYMGGSINISGSSSGQSMSATLPKMKNYKLNPKPLVGGAIAKIPDKQIINKLKKAAIPFLKAEGLLKEGVKNTDKTAKLIEMYAKKAFKTTKDKGEAVGEILAKLKPLLNQKGNGLGLAGAGFFHKLGWKLLSGIFKMGSSRGSKSAFARGATYMAGQGYGGALKLAGQGKGGALKLAGQGKHKGGFVFSIAAIIAAVSAAAASAAAAASTVGAVAIAGTTVGALTTAAITASVTAASGAVVGHYVNKALKEGEKKAAAQGRKLTPKEKEFYVKLGRAQAARSGQKGKGLDPVNIVKQATKQTKLLLKDFSPKDKKVLIQGFKQLKDNPTKSGIIALGKKLAPVARDLMFKKINKKIKSSGVQLVSPEMVQQSGKGIRLAGSGMSSKIVRLPQNLPQKTVSHIKKNAKQFEDKFKKSFVNKLTK